MIGQCNLSPDFRHASERHIYWVADNFSLMAFMLIGPTLQASGILAPIPSHWNDLSLGACAISC